MLDNKNFTTIVYYAEDIKKWEYKLTTGKLILQDGRWFVEGGFTISGGATTAAKAYRSARISLGLSKLYNLLIWLLDKYR
jgi:hypothetical protein